MCGALIEGCEERDVDIESMLKPCAKDAKSENWALMACRSLVRRLRRERIVWRSHVEALREGCEEQEFDFDGMAKPSARGVAIEKLTLKACVSLARGM